MQMEKEFIQQNYAIYESTFKSLLHGRFNHFPLHLGKFVTLTHELTLRDPAIRIPFVMNFCIRQIYDKLDGIESV